MIKARHVFYTLLIYALTYSKYSNAVICAIAAASTALVETLSAALTKQVVKK